VTLYLEFPNSGENFNSSTTLKSLQPYLTEALTANDAQRTENIDTRNRQIEQGLLTAKEKGFGE
jgi:hypothetical protein